LGTVSIVGSFSRNLDEAIYDFTNREIALVAFDVCLSESDRHRILGIMRMLKPIPILLFSEDSKITSIAKMYEAGATMCLCPLRSFDELAIQIKALISLCTDIRNRQSNQQTLSFGTNLIIDPIKHHVFAKEIPVKLTRKEFDLLLCLAKHPGHVFTREQLYQQVWGTDYSYNVDDVVKTHIKTLRKKLSETEQDHIQNVWGVGYRFEPK